MDKVALGSSLHSLGTVPFSLDGFAFDGVAALFFVRLERISSCLGTSCEKSSVGGSTMMLDFLGLVFTGGFTLFFETLFKGFVFGTKASKLASPLALVLESSSCAFCTLSLIESVSVLFCTSVFVFGEVFFFFDEGGLLLGVCARFFVREGRT